MLQWRSASRAGMPRRQPELPPRTARDGEAVARTIAEKARDGERNARAVAETARNEIAAAREALARIEYGRTMEVALQEWRDANVGATLTLLKSTRPDLRGWEWRYVDRLCNSDLLTINVDASSASFSPDGSRVVTSGRDGTAKVWDAGSGAPGPHAQGARGSRDIGVVQPRRIARGHRQSRQYGEGLGRQERRPSLHAHGALSTCRFRVVQPRRSTVGHRKLGRYGEGLGRQKRRRSSHAHGAHWPGSLGRVQPRRVAHRHGKRGRYGKGLGRQNRNRGPLDQRAARRDSNRHRSARMDCGSSLRVGTIRRRSGTPGAAPRSLPSRGTPAPFFRHRSAPTDGGSSAAATTTRRRSGTSPAAQRSSPSRATPQPSCRRRSARTARGCLRAVLTERRNSGTPERAMPRLTCSRGTPVRS